MPILLVVVLCLCLVAAGTVYYSIASHRLRAAPWESLLAQIQPVDLRGLESIALHTLQPRTNPVRLDSTEIWEILGGLEGLERLKNNASVLIALAAYAQQWNQQEASLVAEHMRRDAIQLKKALRHIRLGLLLHRHPAGQPFYVHDAAASYYLMTQRLLMLYQICREGLLPQLAQAL
jgi:hypothetical protein